jgi:hypothetical protein
VTAVYLGIMAVGAALLLALARWHQRLLPLERVLERPTWIETAEPLPPLAENLECDQGRIVLHIAAGETLAFAAPGLDVGPNGWAVLDIGGRRLLALLDRGSRKRTLLVDPDRAAQGGSLDAGLVGGWRHGTGRLLAMAGHRLLEVHGSFGRDRIYVVDPLQAAAGAALSLGIAQTLFGPRRGLTRIRTHGRELLAGDGERVWKTDLA